MELLKYYTGFLPRELKFLKDSNSFAAFADYRLIHFRQRIFRVYDLATERTKKEFNETLKNIFMPKNRHSFSIPGTIYDQGLFYHSKYGFECISGPARMAVMPLLSQAIQEDLPPIESVQVN